MSMAHASRSGSSEPGRASKPAGLRELTPRAIVCGFAVALIMGASYPYIVLKLGFGPNVSVVAAFFGYLALGLVVKDYNRWENNLVQTAGTAAAQTAFMCVLLAAFDMLNASRTVQFSFVLMPMQSFLWLTAAGLLGVFLAVPMRQHFIVDERLTYADGLAAGETLIVLDGKGADAHKAARALMIGTLASAVVMLMTEDAYVLKWFPSVMLLGSAITMTTGVGVNWSLLSLGSGMLVGLRINASMLAGTVFSWVLMPYLLLRYGVIAPTFTRNDVLFWVMWPATGMMVAGGLAGLALRWNVLAKTFRNLTRAQINPDDFPLTWVVAGAAVSAVALIVIQKVSLGLDVWITAAAVIFSVPLMLVGLRVLGETNWGPISPLSNMMQGVFGILAPGQILTNMIASGTTGTIAIESEALMQDYKAGDVIGSTPRYLTYMQLLATPIGAATVSWMYPLLRDTYGIVGPHAALSSPISRKWAGFAEILSRGFSALPPGAVAALVVGVILGVIFTVLESRDVEWVPSPTAAGIGALVPAAVIVVMFLGSIIDTVWRRTDPPTHKHYMVPLSSGFIAGEAIVAVIIPLLIMLGILRQ